MFCYVLFYFIVDTQLHGMRSHINIPSILQNYFLDGLISGSFRQGYSYTESWSLLEGNVIAPKSL